MARITLCAPVSPAVLDALATVGADTEDMESEPVESDGDSEAEGCTWTA